MLVKEKLGNINTTAIFDKDIDAVLIEWYEAHRRILHKQTKSGAGITIKFLQENPNLEDGDILWQDENSVIAVEINPCKCIVIAPHTMLAASAVCYELGNRHLPLFYQADELLVPYETPLYNLLLVSGYDPAVEERKLNHALRTTALPHLRIAGTGSLFDSIFQPTTS